MKLIERYIFFRAFSAFLMTVAALTAIVWLTQALRDLDLMTAKGQTMLVFFSMTSLALPTLIMVIAPFAVMIAVAFTLNSLNAESELVVINATSAPPWVVIKPIVILGLLITLLGGTLSLYVAPKSLGTLRSFITQVRADLVANIVKEGIFTEIEDGMTFHIQKRQPNGIMRGLFLSDERDPKKHIVYSSEFAQIIENERGTFLKMDQGTIQQQQPEETAKGAPEGQELREVPGFSSVNIIYFDSYAIDLSKFTGVNDSGPRYYKPRELSTEYLLNPDPDDQVYNHQIKQARSELHDRFTNPLYNLAFAGIIAAFLGQVRTTRERRGDALILAIVAAAGVRLLGFAATSTAIQTPFAVPFMYLLPISAIVLSLWIAITGKRMTLVDNLIRKMELVTDGLFQKMSRWGKKRKSVELS